MSGMNTRSRWGAGDNWQRRSTIRCLWGCLKSNWIFPQTVGNWGVLGEERSVDNSVLHSDWKWSRMALPLLHKHLPSRKSFSLMDLVTLFSPCIVVFFCYSCCYYEKGRSNVACCYYEKGRSKVKVKHQLSNVRLTSLSETQTKVIYLCNYIQIIISYLNIFLL